MLGCPEHLLNFGKPSFVQLLVLLCKSGFRFSLTKAATLFIFDHPPKIAINGERTTPNIDDDHYVFPLQAPNPLTTTPNMHQHSLAKGWEGIMIFPNFGIKNNLQTRHTRHNNHQNERFPVCQLIQISLRESSKKAVFLPKIFPKLLFLSANFCFLFPNQRISRLDDK